MNKCSNCLIDLVGIKGLCECENCNQFYLQDFLPMLPIKYFANVASNEYPTGKEFARQLIRSGVQKFIGMFDTINTQTFNVNNAIQATCSSCTFSNLYTTNTGIRTKITDSSILGYTTFSKLRLKTNHTGTATVVIDDGVEAKFFQIDLVAFTEQMFEPNYQSNQKTISIYFTDQTIGLANITCPTSGGCGCGGGAKNNQLSNYFKIGGLNNSNDSTTQYGFLPCIEYKCDSEMLICAIAKRYPNTFAQAISYIVGVDFYTTLLTTPRKNETTLNIDMEIVKENKNELEGKLHELVYGGKAAYGKNQTGGIAKILDSSYKNIKDYCISCETGVYSATATF
jgi:hypothetical protein